MLFLRKPSRSVLEAFLSRQRDAPFSYALHGCTAAPEAPPGYVRDHLRIELGNGSADFQTARTAICDWKMFDLGWTAVVDPNLPLVAEREVGVLARVAGIWTLSACRIVEVFDAPGRRFGFAYGTLATHPVRGEERFLVELDSAGRVWFDLIAVSRPRRWALRVARPVVRILQRRFRRGAGIAMQQAVHPGAQRAQGRTRPS
jgi:uncharacterized protein (UPF0548 family)